MINNFASTYLALPTFGVGFGLLSIGAILFIALVIAVFALKGFTLWIAAKRNEKGWFTALLILNTFGILELIYLYFVADYWKKNSSHAHDHNHPHDHTHHTSAQ